MSDLKGLNKLRRIVGWSVIGLIAVIGVSILLSYLIHGQHRFFIIITLPIPFWVVRSYPLSIRSFLGDKVVIIALAMGRRILFLWIS
jgi:hypothetical protein